MFNIYKNDNKLLEQTEEKKYEKTGLILVFAPFALSGLFYIANEILNFL